MLQNIKKPITIAFYLLFVCLVGYGMSIATMQLLASSYTTITGALVNRSFLEVDIIFWIIAMFIFANSVEITFIIWGLQWNDIKIVALKSTAKLAMCVSPVIIGQAMTFCKLRFQLSNDILHAVIFTTFIYLVVQIFTILGNTMDDEDESCEYYTTSL